MLTQDRLKELSHYNNDTGDFTWLQSGKGRRLDLVAGSLIHGYIMIKIDRKKYLAHRLAFLYMVGRWPTHQMDHINHIRDDNRWFNLREATRAENGRNMSISCRNTSGCVGVRWHRRDERWVAQIKVDGKNIHLGYFKDKADAIAVRKAANVKYRFHENHGMVKA